MILHLEICDLQVLKMCGYFKNALKDQIETLVLVSSG